MLKDKRKKNLKRKQGVHNNIGREDNSPRKKRKVTDEGEKEEEIKQTVSKEQLLTDTGDDRSRSNDGLRTTTTTDIERGLEIEDPNTRPKEIAGDKGKEPVSEEEITVDRVSVTEVSVVTASFPDPATVLLQMAEPRITSIGEENSLDRNRQILIMDFLNTAVTAQYERQNIANEKRKDVFRLGSVVLSADAENSVMGKNELTVPNGVINAEALIQSEPDLRKEIKNNVISTLTKSGQLAYLRDRGLLDDKNWKIIVDVDFYYDRPKEAIIFHKDTVGKTMFVNLNFNNATKILGPEYVLNPPVLEGHLSHTQLHPTFLADVRLAQGELPKATEISATQVPPFGIVSFVDELVHHSTPYRGHRGIHISEIEKDLSTNSPVFRKWKAANDFTNFVKTSGSSDTVTQEKLTQELSEYPDLSNYLLNSITNSQMRTLLRNNPEYNRLKELLTPDIGQDLQGFRQFVSIVEDTSEIRTYSKDQIRGLGLLPDQVRFLFSDSSVDSITNTRMRILLGNNDRYIGLKARLTPDIGQDLSGFVQFVNSVEDTSRITFHGKEELSRYGLLPSQIDFLFPNPITIERIRLKLDGLSDYIEMLTDAEKYRSFATRGFIQKEELIEEGMFTKEIADAIFLQKEKPNLSKVSLATVGDVDFPEAPKLTRQLSSSDLQSLINQSSTGKRQFFRTWVQAIPVSTISSTTTSDSEDL